MATDVRAVLLNAIAPLLDETTFTTLSDVLPGMDYPEIRQLFGQVDAVHQHINSLRIDILTLCTAEIERQGLDNNDTKPTTEVEKESSSE